MNQVEKKSLFLKEKLNPPGTMRYECADKIILYFGKKNSCYFFTKLCLWNFEEKKHLCTRVWGNPIGFKT